MAIKYQCPLCETLFDNEEEAEYCRDECAKDKYPVVEITECVGQCGTCRNCDFRGIPFADCPHSSKRNQDDGCDAYVPDILTFGTKIETLWREQLEARA